MVVVRSVQVEWSEVADAILSIRCWVAQWSKTVLQALEVVVVEAGLAAVAVQLDHLLFVPAVNVVCAVCLVEA